MKKTFSFIGIICTLVICVLGFPKQVFATNQVDVNDSGDTVYLKTYEEYEQLMNQFDENEVNKIEYIKQLINELENIKKSSEIPLYKAKVLSISEPEMQYIQDTSTAQFARGLYQNGEVEIIDEGNLKGVKLTYLICLTYDVYGNITMPEVKVGDIVNITLMQFGEGEDITVVASSAEPDTYVKRFPTMLAITVIALIIIIAFLGKHSIKLVIPVLLAVDIFFGVLAPVILEGFNLWILVFFAIILNAIAICVLKLGVNTKAFTAAFTTFIISVVGLFVHAILDSFLNFSGLTTESFLMSSGVAPNIIANEIVNIFNFHSLSIAVTLLTMFIVIVLTACKTAETYEENKAKLKADELISEEVKSYISEISLVAIFVMLANTLPKHMLLLVKSYTPEYILQSEIFLIEFLRILVMLLMIVITVPITLIISKFLED